MLLSDLPIPEPETSYLMPATLIITAEPAPFEQQFHDRLGSDVFVVDDAEEAFELLASENITRVYADFRQLEGQWKGQRWSGQRFLREMKETPRLADIPVFVMANSWEPHQEQWLTQRMKAAAMVKRDPVAIARALRGEKPVAPPSPAFVAFLDAADAHFRNFAGPMAELHIRSMRSAISNGTMPQSRTAYVNNLASKLSLQAQRNAFLAAASPKMRKTATENNPVTSALDPWMTEVNRHFTRFAGGLGARLIITEALNQLATDPNVTREDYLHMLAARIANPAARADFLELVRSKEL